MAILEQFIYWLKTDIEEIVGILTFQIR